MKCLPPTSRDWTLALSLTALMAGMLACGSSAGGGGGGYVPTDTDASYDLFGDVSPFDSQTDTTPDVNPLSCAGRCGAYDSVAACQCNPECLQTNTCCTDYDKFCATTCNVAGNCDDGDPCTFDDCNDGSCVHSADLSCCKLDSDCGSPMGCSMPTCENSKCVEKPKPGCCAFGECCDFDKSQIKPAGSPCGTQLLATETQCSDNLIQQREKVAGCDGQIAEVCSQDPNDGVWSEWKTISVCDKTAGCIPGAPGELPTCKDGKLAECVDNAGCADKNPCTTDICKDTKCLYGPAAAGVACGTKPLKSEYKCSTPGADGDVMVRNSVAGCDGSEAMQCTEASPAWGQWQIAKACSWDQVCKVTDPNTIGTCVAKPACTPDTTCCTPEGTYAAEGSACGKTTLDTETKCETTEPGGKILTRKAVAGCSGYSTYCQNSSSSYSWGPWEVTKSCTQFQACQESWNGAECISPCKAGATCCTADGIYAALGTKCGSYELDKEQKCSGPEKGGKILSRKSYQGCTGDSTSCSSQDAYLAWTDWAVEKTCGSTQVCEVQWGSASCVSAIKCQAGSTCCTADGAWAAKGTKCSSYANESQYKCDSTAKGGKILVRKGYDGCTGTGASCSWDSIDTWWDVWTDSETCGATEKCQVNASGTSGSCVSAIVCNAGTSCCTPDGDYAPKGAKCGDYVKKSEYKCAGIDKGADILVRESYSGCTGSSTWCSFDAADDWWSDWKIYKTCSAAQYCSVASPNFPGTCTSTAP
ncbi:MAG: hypothetical protein ACOYOB_09755 [Myxococcota bacterium]